MTRMFFSDMIRIKRKSPVGTGLLQNYDRYNEWYCTRHYIYPSIICNPFFRIDMSNIIAISSKKLNVFSVCPLMTSGGVSC